MCTINNDVKTIIIMVVTFSIACIIMFKTHTPVVKVDTVSSDFTIVNEVDSTHRIVEYKNVKYWQTKVQDSWVVGGRL